VSPTYLAPLAFSSNNAKRVEKAWGREIQQRATSLQKTIPCSAKKKRKVRKTM